MPPLPALERSGRSHPSTGIHHQCCDKIQPGRAWQCSIGLAVASRVRGSVLLIGTDPSTNVDGGFAPIPPHRLRDAKG